MTENDARTALIDAALRMTPLGINTGRAGNLSLRWHRGGEDGLLVTPAGLAYEHTSLDDIVWVPLAVATDEDPQAAWPTRMHGVRTPSSEWRLHRDLYRTRADAQAIVHAHPPHATALACLPRIHANGIPAFHYMIAVAGGHDIRCAPYATYGTAELSRHAQAALRDRRACLLAQHGTVALGTSLASALELAVEVESLAQMYWLALQVGEPVLLDVPQMDEVLARFARYRPDTTENV